MYRHKHTHLFQSALFVLVSLFWCTGVSFDHLTGCIHCLTMLFCLLVLCHPVFRSFYSRIQEYKFISQECLYCTEKELQSLKGWLCCRAATIRVSRKKGGSGSSTPQTPQSAVVRSSWLDVWKGFRWHYHHHHHYCFSDLLLLSQSFITNLNKILVELKLSLG